MISSDVSTPNWAHQAEAVAISIGTLVTLSPGSSPDMTPRLLIETVPEVGDNAELNTSEPSNVVRLICKKSSSAAC